MLCAPLDGRPPESPAQSDVPSLFLPWVGMASLLESEPQLFLQRRFLWRGWWFKNVGRFRVKLFLSVQSRRGLCWPLVPAVCPAGAELWLRFAFRLRLPFTYKAKRWAYHGPRKGVPLRERWRVGKCVIWKCQFAYVLRSPPYACRYLRCGHPGDMGKVVLRASWEYRNCREMDLTVLPSRRPKEA